MLLDITKNNSGFSILEVLGGVVVFSLISISVFGLFSMSIMQIYEMHNKTKAVQLAQGEMEFLMSIPFESVTGIEDTSFDFGDYTIQHTIRPVGQAPNNNDLVFLEVDIAWLTNRGPTNYTLKMYKSRR